MKLFQQPIAQLGSVTPPAIVSIPAAPMPSQLVNLKNDLQGCVNELKKCNRIIGKPLALEEMLNPAEEREIGYSPYHFEGGGNSI